MGAIGRTLLPKTLLSMSAFRSAGRTRDRGAIRTARRSDRLYRPGCQSGHARGGAPIFDASLPVRDNPPGERDLAAWLAKCRDPRLSNASNGACGQANEAPATARERAFNRLVYRFHESARIGGFP